MRIISWIIKKFKSEPDNRFDILSDTMNSNDKIETVKEGFFTFYIDELNLEESKNCKVGDHVNFWSPEDSSDIVYIYRSGTVGGLGKIGFVPIEYAETIAEHIKDGLKYETEIVYISGELCEIKCKLISRREIEEKEHKNREILFKELTKNYVPRKPVSFFINAIDRKCIKPGDKLKIKFKPIEFYLENYKNGCYLWKTEIYDSYGKLVAIKKDENSTVIKRLLKAHFNSYCFEIIILSITAKHNWYKNPVQVLATAQKEHINEMR